MLHWHISGRQKKICLYDLTSNPRSPSVYVSGLLQPFHLLPLVRTLPLKQRRPMEDTSNIKWTNISSNNVFKAFRELSGVQHDLQTCVPWGAESRPMTQHAPLFTASVVNVLHNFQRITARCTAHTHTTDKVYFSDTSRNTNVLDHKRHWSVFRLSFTIGCIELLLKYMAVLRLE